ncbi:uncharacterized protein LOC112604046 isoform X1 [Melanaphis sacchari]|uniref:uncharacterized protein LOC112604046 isoform X1 n=1 Tax=Melanaphis sacchari TaxID=742174 RepID=UPI000DC13EB9|nr:uncharacterized protein LOC112604046 isoform X1 [Melanaphis sacchari]XP_025208692.1 uncharacterized protein LOC112604046 isoform X1 [Melanaphis sacchari]XP_025208693.1 uncharacterized protein LOC112604046 isoform X1 [Melanaphis sacchari]
MDGNTRNNSWNRFLEENVTRASVKIKQEDEEHMLDMPSDKIKQEDEEYMLDMPSVSEQSALPSVPEQPAQLPVTLFVIGFECAMCHEKVMEIRSFPCEHSVCVSCAPTQCSVACRKSFLDIIKDNPDLYDKVSAGYQLSGGELLRMVVSKNCPKKKRRSSLD